MRRRIYGTSREGGLRYRLTRALETRVFRNADAVTTICEGLRGDIVARGIDAGEGHRDPQRRGPGALSLSACRPMRRCAETLGLGEGPVIGFIGSFYAYEGLDLLMDALPALREREPALRVLLVGGGNEANGSLERSASAWASTTGGRRRPGAPRPRWRTTTGWWTSSSTRASPCA